MKQKFSWKDWDLDPIIGIDNKADLRWVNHIGFGGFTAPLRSKVLILGDLE